MEFEEWVKNAPVQMKSDPLWNSKYYQLAMYLCDLVWEDCNVLRKDFRGFEVSKQLMRSAGGICANMEEAYGRGMGSADHVRILRIALGEARETQGWYLRARHLLSQDTLQERLDVIGQLIALLVSAISTQSRKTNKKS
jgi:four helix bundle protein